MTVDQATGEILSHDCASCNRLSAEAAGLTRDLDATQDSLTKALTQIKALKTQDENRRERHRRRAEVAKCFEDWQRICDRAKCFLTPDRFDVIAARLNNGYTVERFELAAVGAMNNNPWKPKAGEKPMVEIATYASQGRWLDQFEEAGVEWRAQGEKPKRHLALASSAPRPVDVELVHWQLVRVANRRRLLAVLRGMFGHGLEVENDELLFPCPRCMNDPATTLRLVDVHAGPICWCFVCGLDDRQMLRTLALREGVSGRGVRVEEAA